MSNEAFPRVNAISEGAACPLPVVVMEILLERNLATCAANSMLDLKRFGVVKGQCCNSHEAIDEGMLAYGGTIKPRAESVLPPFVLPPFDGL